MKKIISIQFARKRSKETDYRKRLKMILSGKERFAVRKTSNQIIAQVIKYDDKGDRVVATATSMQLKKYGWSLNPKNIPAAYLTGMLAAKIATSRKIKEAILDAGTKKPKSNGRIYAALKGAIDGGLQIPLSEEVIPGEDRISGKHLKDGAKATEMFNSVKAKIAGGKNE